MSSSLNTPTASTGRSSTADTGESRRRPPADTQAAFEEALLRLQRQRRDEEAAAGGPEAPLQQAAAAAQALPQPAGDAATPGLAAAAAAANAPSPAGARLSGSELSGYLSALQMPASPEGPQLWEFQFAGDSGLAVQGLTLSGTSAQPGSALTVHLHANPNVPLRDRELSAQRLDELRQRLGERGAPVQGLHWSDGEGSQQHGGSR
jgi:hypothetical protein